MIDVERAAKHKANVQLYAEYIAATLALQEAKTSDIQTRITEQQALERSLMPFLFTTEPDILAATRAEALDHLKAAQQNP